MSYDPSDEELARTLAQHLGTAGIRVWFAEEELQPGDNWASKTGEALETSDVMTVLVTPGSGDSAHVERELQYALSAKQYRGRVIPIIVGDPKRVPWILHKLHAITLGPTPNQEDIDGLIQRIRSLELSTA